MTSPMDIATQFSSAKPFFSKKPDANLAGSPEDAQRIQAYRLYEDIFHNRPETFSVTMRGEDEDSTPIYLPSGKKHIEAVNRFLAVDFNYTMDPSRGTPADRGEAKRLMDNLFKRERFFAKFASQRRYGLVRGDALWHITADENKEEGKRISIHELNPSNYFAIEDPNVAERILGCHIVDVIQDPRDKEDKSKFVARRQTYLRKGVVHLPTGGYEVPEGSELEPGVTSELTLWTIGKWDDRYMKDEDLEKVSTPVPLFELPPEITTVPVYHIRNNRIPGAIYGLSELSGIETIVNAINQSITDEDLTLIMQGLGMYWTNAAPPQNADGSDGTWDIGPGSVVEVGDENTFGRVTGVSSVAPYLEHIKYIDEFAQQSLGIPDIAAGRVDVSIAESGISLRLQMAPLLAKNSEKEEEILGIQDQMIYDLLHQWLPAFEDLNGHEEITAACVVGDPMPENREARIQEVMLLQAAGLITIAQAQAELSKFGYTFASGDETKVIAEAAAIAKATSGDPFVNRYSQELEAEAEETYVGTAAPSAAAQAQGLGAPTP